MKKRILKYSCLTPAGRRRGFTLLELLVALAIVGALLALAFGSLRVGLAAWRQGDDRAEAHAHLRSLSEVLARSVAAAFPYRQSRAEGGEPRSSSRARRAASPWSRWSRLFRWRLP